MGISSRISSIMPSVLSFTHPLISFRVDWSKGALRALAPKESSHACRNSGSTAKRSSSVNQMPFAMLSL